MEYGDINMYLKTHSDADRVLLASDVAHGLKFLHNNNVIHGDLKGPNILVDDTGTACVADFGLSSISDPNIPALTSYSSVASKGGSVRWQAPELINPESEDDIHNTIETLTDPASTDMQIFVAKLPFYQYPRDHTVSFKVMSGERPVQPEKGSPTWGDWGLTNDIWSMMQKCWSAEVKKRPTVDNIIERLRAGLGKDGRVDKKRSSLAPAHFRELVREGVDPVDMSVEAFEALLKETCPEKAGLDLVWDLTLHAPGWEGLCYAILLWRRTIDHLHVGDHTSALLLRISWSFVYAQNLAKSNAAALVGEKREADGQEPEGDAKEADKETKKAKTSKTDNGGEKKGRGRPRKDSKAKQQQQQGEEKHAEGEVAEGVQVDVGDDATKKKGRGGRAKKSDASEHAPVVIDEAAPAAHTRSKD
ncbi:hypothetical protein H0H93_003476 [Arthromyces matolae]|nr:hypothetical protein H0H93_003476 [Arthromyces matolae]